MDKDLTLGQIAQNAADHKKGGQALVDALMEIRAILDVILPSGFVYKFYSMQFGPDGSFYYLGRDKNLYPLDKEWHNAGVRFYSLQTENCIGVTANHSMIRSLAAQLPIFLDGLANDLTGQVNDFQKAAVVLARMAGAGKAAIN
jgi:hypothetical protein